MERPNNPSETKYLLIGGRGVRTSSAQLLYSRQGASGFRISLRSQRPSDVPVSRGRVRSARHYARRAGRAPPETTDQGESFPAADDVQPLRSGTPRRTSRAP